MLSLLRSPRRRRQLAWSGGLLAAVAAVAVSVAVMPGGKSRPPDRLRPGLTYALADPPQRPIRLTAAMRRDINATLSRFIPAAVDRRDPTTGWHLAGPGLRAGTTRRGWLEGDLPMDRYPFRGDLPGDWRPHSTYRSRVSFDLLLHAREGAKVGSTAFGVEMVRRGRRWLVDYWAPVAIMEAPGERPYVMGAVDYAAGGGTAKNTYEAADQERAKLGAAWLVVPGIVVASGLLLGLALALLAVVRNRRAAARPLY